MSNKFTLLSKACPAHMSTAPCYLPMLHGSVEEGVPFERMPLVEEHDITILRFVTTYTEYSTKSWINQQQQWVMDGPTEEKINNLVPQGMNSLQLEASWLLYLVIGTKACWEVRLMHLQTCECRKLHWRLFRITFWTYTILQIL